MKSTSHLQHCATVQGGIGCSCGTGHFKAGHHQTFARLFVEAEDMAADLFRVDGELSSGEAHDILEEIRGALRTYRNLLLKQVGASPL